MPSSLRRQQRAMADADVILFGGGGYFNEVWADAFPARMIELELAFKKISDELRSQYLITYRPENQNYDGRERKIEVRFTNRDMDKKYNIRTKKSYRAIKDTLK